MISIAERLSDGVDFVRVDLYDLGDRVVFGELTNYPRQGWEYFTRRNGTQRLVLIGRLPAET
jgi:hypothetical protein